MFSEVLYYTAALPASLYQPQLAMGIILWYFLSLPYTFWNNQWHGLSHISMQPFVAYFNDCINYCIAVFAK
jgi:hypothetical protein